MSGAATAPLLGPIKPELLFGSIAPVGLLDQQTLRQLSGGVCMDLRGLQGTDTASLEKSAAQFPFPLFALVDSTSDRAHPLVMAADCVLTDMTELAPLQAGIARAPIAAMTLVKLSRAIESLSLESALDMESMAFATLQGGIEFADYLAKREPIPAPVVSDESPVALARSEHTLTVTLNQPVQRNAIGVRMRDALVEGLQLALADESITRVVLNGAGKCFSVGGELAEFGTCPDTSTAHLVRTLALPGRMMARLSERSEAHVHGACIGAGIELPAFAGKVLAARNSHFQLPELTFGLIPGAGGCVSISRRIGRQRFNWFALTSKRINARTALEWGLVDEIVDSLPSSGAGAA